MEPSYNRGAWDVTPPPLPSSLSPSPPKQISRRQPKDSQERIDLPYPRASRMDADTKKMPTSPQSQLTFPQVDDETPPSTTHYYSILQNSKTDDPNALPPPSTHLPASLA